MPLDLTDNRLVDDAMASLRLVQRMGALLAVAPRGTAWNGTLLSSPGWRAIAGVDPNNVSYEQFDVYRADALYPTAGYMTTTAADGYVRPSVSLPSMMTSLEVSRMELLPGVDSGCFDAPYDIVVQSADMSRYVRLDNPRAVDTTWGSPGVWSVRWEGDPVSIGLLR